MMTFNQPDYEGQDLQNAPSSSSILLMLVVFEASLQGFLYRRKHVETYVKRHYGLYPHRDDSSPWIFYYHYQ